MVFWYGGGGSGYFYLYGSPDLLEQGNLVGGTIHLPWYLVL